MEPLRASDGSDAVRPSTAAETRSPVCTLDRRLRRRHARIVLAVLAGFCSFTGLPSEAASADTIPSNASKRLAQILVERHVDVAATWPGGASRGLRDIFHESVSAVPLVVATDATGSSVVISVDRPHHTALLVTNHHVVESPFVNEENNTRSVVLLFYHPTLAKAVFDQSGVVRCLTTSDSSAWCSTLRSVTRVGIVAVSDPSHDLALLFVRDVPDWVRPIALGTVDAVVPGDDVVVIGHPLGFLWSLTTGIVSGIRSHYQMSPSGVEGTVVQTQTPINPGNSGGPLLTFDGKLIGIMFAARTVRAAHQGPGVDVRVVAPGLNFAIGVNEVERFISKQRSGAPQ